MNRAAILIPAAAGITVVLAACGQSSGTTTSQASAAAASVRASASASWNAPANKQVRHATRTTEKQAELCASTAQFHGSALGIHATLPQPFSGQKPAVSGVRYVVYRHPVTALEAIGTCMGYTEADIKACAQQAVPTSIHIHGLLGEALVTFSTCLSTKAQGAAPTPSATS